MVSLRDSLDTQSLALTQMQGIVTDLQSQVDTLNLNSANNTNTTTPVVNNNYYTTIVQTGSTDTGSGNTPTTIINNYYYNTGSTVSGEISTIVSTNTGENNTNIISLQDTTMNYSGSTEWTHS